MVCQSLNAYWPLTFLVLVSCGTGGNLVSREQVKQIEIGTSTRNTVEQIFGEPITKTHGIQGQKEKETWTYYLAKYASDRQSGVPPIGLSDSFPNSWFTQKPSRICIHFDSRGTVPRLSSSISQ